MPAQWTDCARTTTCDPSPGPEKLMSPLSRALRRISSRLTDPVEVLDAEELADRIAGSGARCVVDVDRGDRATLTGRIRTVVTGRGDDHLGVTAEVFDGTGAIEVCWLGRGSIPGIDTGRYIRVEGRVGIRHGRKIMFNPRYELLIGQPGRTGGGNT